MLYLQNDSRLSEKPYNIRMQFKNHEMWKTLDIFSNFFARFCGLFFVILLLENELVF